MSKEKENLKEEFKEFKIPEYFKDFKIPKILFEGRNLIIKNEDELHKFKCAVLGWVIC